MRSILTTAGVALALVASGLAIGLPKTALGESPTKPGTPTAASASGPARQQDEKAIRAAVEAFAKAYNAGEAKTIVSLFVADGEIVSEEGQSTQGREGIRQVFAAIFQQHPKTHMDLAVGSIRFVGPALAVEDGMATVIHASDEPAQRGPYTMVHVLRDGQWLMASSRDLPDEAATPEEQLKQLQWMIGDWVDESPDALVVTSYRWTDNQCYILSEFKVQISGRPVMTGSQRIGWDPLAKKIHSWVFDSEGGFGEGIWTRDGNRWIVKMNGVTRDGKIASATNITTRVSRDRMTWQSRDRIVGGDKTPDIEEIPITRKPPPPMSPDIKELPSTRRPSPPTSSEIKELPSTRRPPPPM
jgi:uncharacterized protein (TIGR02246 family)